MGDFQEKLPWSRLYAWEFREKPLNSEISSIAKFKDRFLPEEFSSVNDEINAEIGDDSCKYSQNVSHQYREAVDDFRERTIASVINKIREATPNRD